MQRGEKGQNTNGGARLGRIGFGGRREGHVKQQGQVGVRGKQVLCMGFL